MEDEQATQVFATTTVEYTLTVTDTSVEKAVAKRLGNAATITDTDAFATCG